MIPPRVPKPGGVNARPSGQRPTPPPPPPLVINGDRLTPLVDGTAMPDAWREYLIRRDQLSAAEREVFLATMKMQTLVVVGATNLEASAERDVLDALGLHECQTVDDARNLLRNYGVPLITR